MMHRDDDPTGPPPPFLLKAPWTVPSLSLTANGAEMARVVSGEVMIDWKEVERALSAASEPDHMARDLAQLMTAIRDGTWRPFRARNLS